MQRELGRRETPRGAYFDELAAAMLQGRLHLESPAQTYDLTPHDGRWYVPFPPLPALLMLPILALGGRELLNVPAFSAIVGAVGAALVLLLLDALRQRDWSRLRERDNLWLALLFAFGTVYFCATVESSVWFLGHVCTLPFVVGALLIAARGGSGLASGTCLGIALWGRPTVLFTALLAAALASHGGPESGSRGRRKLWLVTAALPIGTSIAGLSAYNYARFGNALDFGYAAQNVSTALATDLRAYGQFHPRYVLRNVYTLLLAPPRWPKDWTLPRPDEQGMSLLLTTPALLCLWNARPRAHPPAAPLVRAAWASVLLTLVPLLLYYNTGWSQFGYRFSLDFQVPLFVLLAVGVGTRVNLAMKVLIGMSVLVNTYGTWWFLMKPMWKAIDGD